MRRSQLFGMGRLSTRARARMQVCAERATEELPPVPSGLDPTCVPAHAREALEVLMQAGKQAFLVGGFVRDALRGAAPHDVDMTTDALWYQTRDIFIERGYRVLETGAQHGTVTVFVGGQPIEVTTFRADGVYSDHRRPDSVRYVRDVEDDLARRDFTVNAMAWSPDRGLVDPFGGREDLAQGLVRAVGEPCQRFGEDALRIMRGVRFASKLGFEVEERTASAIHACAPDLALVARERIASEYDGIVGGPGAVGALRLFPDVAAAAVPAILAMVGFDQHSKWHCYDVWEHCLHALEILDPNAGPLARHVALLHDVGKPSTFTMGADGRGHFYGHEEQGSRMLRRAFENLRWRRCDIDRACCLVRLHDHRIDPTPRGVRRVLARISASFSGAQDCAADLFRILLQVKRADTMAHAPGCVDKRISELDRLESVFAELVTQDAAFCVRDLQVDGNDVIGRGVAPGPAVGLLLKRLLALVIDGKVPNERATLLEALDGLCADEGGISRDIHKSYA